MKNLSIDLNNLPAYQSAFKLVRKTVSKDFQGAEYDREGFIIEESLDKGSTLVLSKEQKILRDSCRYF